MANEEHLAIVQQGVEVWNQWREEHPDVRPDLSRAHLQKANFYGANLSRTNLQGADLQGADLEETNLMSTDLRGTHLSRAYLIKANLQDADLQGADLQDAYIQDANLYGADLQGADLRRTHLQGADLRRTHLQRANLQGANLTRTYLQGTYLQEAKMQDVWIGKTVFADMDLRAIQGLASVKHRGPSTIGIDTLYRSQGQISQVFLRGCGIPDSMIEYACSLVTAERPIDYYSCFISYSSHDEALAERLYADLQAKGVRCWYAPEDLKIGESILGGIDQAIRLHDKLLLLFSESSVNSAWVDAEVQMALVRERSERRRVLFPVRIDDAVLTSRASWAALVRGDYHIGDFRKWHDYAAYQQAFQRLLRDLKAEQL